MPLVPRWICSLTFFIFPTNAGLTVGEEVEAVNSFMSRAALTTKYMTKSGESLGLIKVIVKYVQYLKWTCSFFLFSARTDMITIHVRGWNLRKKLNLHNYLAQRYVKVHLVLCFCLLILI